MDKFLLELIDLAKFRFKDLDKYHYNIYYIVLFLGIYIIIYSSLNSLSISFDNVYQLIYTFAVLELSRIFICTFIFLKRGKQDNPKYYFKYLFNFFVLLAIFNIPAMALTAFSPKVFIFLLFIFNTWSIIILIYGIRFFYNYSYITIILKYIIFIVLSSILFAIIISLSVRLNIIDPSSILVNGMDLKEICRESLRNNINCDKLY